MRLPRAGALLKVIELSLQLVFPTASRLNPVEWVFVEYSLRVALVMVPVKPCRSNRRKAYIKGELSTERDAEPPKLVLGRLLKTEASATGLKVNTCGGAGVWVVVATAVAVLLLVGVGVLVFVAVEVGVTVFVGTAV